MKKELEQKLVERFPEMLVDYGGNPTQTCMAWGFECGDGWFKIIEEVCEKLKDIEGFRFDQVKEKFGMLAIYYTSLDDENAEYVREVIDEAENKSVKTCEICGEPGKRESHNGWLAVECKTCNAIREARNNLRL